MLSKQFLLGFWILILSPAFALNYPQKSVYDGRIRYTAYNPDDVVQLDTVVGVSTHIVLEEGETYLTHVFGDAQAYAFAVEKNHIFIKPRAEDAHTNLIIVTDRRSYNFRLRFCSSMQTAATYQLVFNYPDSFAKKVRKATEQAAQQHAFKTKYGCYNVAYSMSGDQDIAPIHAWDNGEFTYFKFPTHQDLPVIYMIDSDGFESIVNRHTIGPAQDVIAVHKVNLKWILRLGNRALAIYNDAYRQQGQPNTTGTTSSQVQRLVKEDPNE